MKAMLFYGFHLTIDDLRDITDLSDSYDAYDDLVDQLPESLDAFHDEDFENVFIAVKGSILDCSDSECYVTIPESALVIPEQWNQWIKSFQVDVLGMEEIPPSLLVALVDD